MLQCDHEEADTRMCIHLKDALEKGARNILIRTVDTDVVVILVGLFFTLLAEYPDFELWVAFGMGKSYQEIRINSVYDKLGKDKSIALCHVFMPLLDVTPPHSFLVKESHQHG